MSDAPPRKSVQRSASRGEPGKDRPRPAKPSGGSQRGPRGRDRDAEPVPVENAEKPTGFAPREAALDILTLVGKGRSLDEALETCRSFDALEGPDRGLARALASTVLRRRGSLDHLVGAYLDRPLPQKSARVMDILRLAAAQSALMGTPDHAAVSISVALAKAYRETAGYGSLVNAVARKIATGGAAAIAKLPERTDTPGWLWRAWDRQYGPAGARRLATAHRDEAPLDLTVRDKADIGSLTQQLSGVEFGAETIRLTGKSSVSALPGFAAGAFWVQDYAASLPARLLRPSPGETVLDLCAAPGGKTMQLARDGASVIAVDQSGPRLARVQENLARTGLRAETVKADILQWTPKQSVDAVLLDAPCTATGTIRRHPDLPWSKTEDDLAALVRLQSSMLGRSADWVRSGGRLIYCVCSLQVEEGERQITDFLSKRPDFKREPVTAAEIDGRTDMITRDGDLRTLPYFEASRGGMDGFFAARLIRRG